MAEAIDTTPRAGAGCTRWATLLLGHTFSAVNDIGTFEGRQMIDSDKAQAEVVQIGQEAYIRGNTAAISSYFGLTKNDPQQLANTWIPLAPTDGEEYTTVIVP